LQDSCKYLLQENRNASILHPRRSHTNVNQFLLVTAIFCPPSRSSVSTPGWSGFFMDR
jgi:hypothetical protein